MNEVKGRGRPRISKNRKPILMAHIDDAFKEKFAELAKKLGYSESMLIRGLAKELMVKEGLVSAETRFKNTPNLNLLDL